MTIVYKFTSIYILVTLTSVAGYSIESAMSLSVGQSFTCSFQYLFDRSVRDFRL